MDIKQFLFDPTIGKIVFFVAGLIVLWSVIKIVQKTVFSRIKDNSNRYKARKITTFLGYALSLILLTAVYSNKLGGFTVAFGVAGAGIAFALQEVIASFAGWLVIMFGRFYTTGDRVELGGIKGDVMDIGMLRTTLMETGEWVDGDLYNGRIVLIANSFVFKAPVFNYSGDFPFLWDEIKVPIKYGSNYDRTRIMLEDIAGKQIGELEKNSKETWNRLQRKYRLEDVSTQPMVSLIANDNWVEFTLRYVVHYKRRRLTKSALFTEILKQVEATQGEIQFASATFEIVGLPDLQVRVKSRQ